VYSDFQSVCLALLCWW